MTKQKTYTVTLTDDDGNILGHWTARCEMFEGSCYTDDDLPSMRQIEKEIEKDLQSE